MTETNARVGCHYKPRVISSVTFHASVPQRPGREVLVFGVSCSSFWALYLLCPLGKQPRYVCVRTPSAHDELRSSLTL